MIKMGYDWSGIIMIVLSIVFGLIGASKNKKKNVRKMGHVINEIDVDNENNVDSKAAKELFNPFNFLEDQQIQQNDVVLEEETISTPDSEIDFVPQEEQYNAFNEDTFEEGTSSIDNYTYNNDGYSQTEEIKKESIKDRIRKNKKDFVIFSEVLNPKF